MASIGAFGEQVVVGIIGEDCYGVVKRWCWQNGSQKKNKRVSAGR